jgi:acetyl/propionyl-CoA carboxylase alpha subunit
MYQKLLIANRGEIACRIARTARSLGLAVATVHSDADADARHVREIGESVRLGGAPARDSYLDVEAVVAAARRVGADALHPGFGFLSENPLLAQRCEAEGIAFIGPRPETLALFGDKASAKQLARELGIPVAAGVDIPDDNVQRLLAATAGLPLPYILKAVAGGGGKGMRVVREATQAREAMEAAIREGRSAFGDGRLLAERYLERPRHVEVQILGDGAGEVVHLYDRECSLQRRHQKVVEEAPVLSLPLAQRQRLWDWAVALGRASRYRGLGTVEFAVLGEEVVFLEVNPRLQVEHPVTEAVTGLDLVALQIATVAQGRLPLAQAQVPAPTGVAVQARLYAEDPARGFLPSCGRLLAVDPPPPELARCDAGVASGDEISPHYDPMVAKLIAHGADRPQALARLREALRHTTVWGVTSNRVFLLDLLADPAVAANAVHTELIDAWLATRGAGPAQAVGAPELAAAVAGWLWWRREQAGGGDGGAWHDAHLSAWRGRRTEVLHALRATTEDGAQAWRIGFGGSGQADGLRVRVDEVVFTVARHGAGEARRLSVDGHQLPLVLRHAAEGPRLLRADGEVALCLVPLREAREGAGVDAAAQGSVRAPMMGLVTTVVVVAGERVAAGQRLATLESMKMETPIDAPVAGTVAWVGCAARDQVERHQPLFTIES